MINSAHSGEKSDEFGSRTDQKEWNHGQEELNDAIQRRGANVCSIPGEVSAAARTRWLAELAQTLDESQRLLARLELSTEQQAAGVELFMRIEAAKHEVQSLRLSRQSRLDSEPEWTNLAPWQAGGHTSA